MRVRVGVALAGLLVAAAQASADGQWDAGPVTVETSNEVPESCAVGLQGQLCVLGWEGGESPLPGDDWLLLIQDIESIRVAVASPAGPSAEWSFAPRDLAFQHNLFAPANATWGDLNATVAPHTFGWVTFDRQPTRSPGFDTWGLYLGLRLPAPVDTPVTGLMSSFSIGIVCWNVNACPLIVYGNGVVQTSEHSVAFFPDGVILYAWDTDLFFESGADGLTMCSPSIMSPETCQILARARADMDPALGLMESMTPTVATFFHLERAAFALEPPGVANVADADPPGRFDRFEAHGAGRGAAPEAGLADPPVPLAGNEEPGASKGSVGASAPTVGPPEPALVASGMDPRSPVDIVRYALGVLLPALGWALFHRVSRDLALVQPTRRRIYQKLGECPGIRAGTLAHGLGMDPKTVHHHLRHLERLGLVSAIGLGHRRYVQAGKLSPETTRALAEALANPATKKVYDALPGVGIVEFQAVCSRTRLAKSTVSEALARLQAAGLVVKERGAGRLFVRRTGPELEWTPGQAPAAAAASTP